MLAQVTYSVTSQSTTSSSMSGGAVAAIVIGVLIFEILMIGGLWKSLSKAGQPGAMSLFFLLGCLYPLAFIPMMKAIGRPPWWVVLFFIPIVNLVVLIIVSLDVAKSYGKSAAFGIGLWLLAPIFYAILGFGSSTYQGPAVTA